MSDSNSRKYTSAEIYNEWLYQYRKGSSGHGGRAIEKTAEQLHISEQRVARVVRVWSRWIARKTLKALKVL